MRSLMFVLVISLSMVTSSNVHSSEIPANQLQEHQDALASIESQGGLFHPADRRINREEPPRHLDLTRWKGSNYSALSNLHAVEMLTAPGLSSTDLQAINLPELHTVEFVRSTFSDDDFIDFVSRSPRLKNIALSNRNITDQVMASLNNLEHIQSIQFVSTQISNEGVKELPNSLPMISITGGNITPECLETLGSKSNLELIVLPSLQVEDKDIEKLKGLRNLKVLVINKANLTNSGLKHISEISTLETLIVGGTRITNSALPALSKLKSLKTLMLWDTRCSQSGLDQLKTSIWGSEEEAAKNRVQYSLVKSPSAQRATQRSRRTTRRR